MTYIVYADVMFLINAVINICILYLSQTILYIRINNIKTISFGALTSLVTTAIYVITINRCILIYHILYATLYCAMTFWYIFRLNRSHIINVSVSVLASFFLQFGALTFIIKNSAVKSIRLITICFIALIFNLIICMIINRHRSQIKNLHRIKLTHNNHSLNCIAYYDTGNTLIDPYTKRPVIIIDYSYIKFLLGETAAPDIEKFHQTGEFAYDKANINCNNTGFYPIAYHTISSKNALIPAFKLLLNFTDEDGEVIPVTAGISRYHISANGKTYQVLLNESLKPIREEYSND